MSTLTLIDQPTVTQTIDSRHATVAAAPARLDVHRLAELEAWIDDASRSGQLVLDCSAVEFIDLAAVEAILAAESDPARRFRIARPSTAMQITLELLGEAEMAVAA